MEVGFSASQRRQLRNRPVNLAREQAAGKLKEAEKLYLSIDEPDLAITMYRKRRLYDDCARLVQQTRPEALARTHLEIAQLLEVVH